MPNLSTFYQNFEMKYLFWCGFDRLCFRIPEFESICRVLKIQLNWIYKNDSHPWVVLELQSGLYIFPTFGDFLNKDFWTTPCMNNCTWSKLELKRVKRVNPDRNTFSINVELTSSFIQRFGPSPSPNFSLGSSLVSQIRLGYSGS